MNAPRDREGPRKPRETPQGRASRGRARGHRRCNTMGKIHVESAPHEKLQEWPTQKSAERNTLPCVAVEASLHRTKPDPGVLVKSEVERCVAAPLRLRHRRRTCTERSHAHASDFHRGDGTYDPEGGITREADRSSDCLLNNLRRLAVERVLHVRPAQAHGGTSGALQTPPSRCATPSAPTFLRSHAEGRLRSS